MKLWEIGKLLHGGDYNVDQWLDRPDILAEDIRLMKLAGVNVVSLCIFSWSSLEPEEGVYTFEWLDEVMDSMYKNGIYVILATPSAGKPPWLIKKYPDIKLIVIDTLQKVRKQNNDINYSNDYTDISLLKQFADKNKIAVILVHHLRKQDDSDVFNRISGTTGIMGSSDTTFILEKKSRDDSVATLFVTGRDVEYQTFTLRFEECRWNLLERSFQKDIEMKNAPEIIYNVISFVNDKGEWQGTATELLTSLDEKDITPQYLTKLLNEYSKTILLDNKICFKTSRTSTSRLVNFKKDIDGNDDDDGKNIPQESSLKGSPEGTSGTQLL